MLTGRNCPGNAFKEFDSKLTADSIPLARCEFGPVDFANAYREIFFSFAGIQNSVHESRPVHEGPATLRPARMRISNFSGAGTETVIYTRTVIHTRVLASEYRN